MELVLMQYAGVNQVSMVLIALTKRVPVTVTGMAHATIRRESANAPMISLESTAASLRAQSTVATMVCAIQNQNATATHHLWDQTAAKKHVLRERMAWSAVELDAAERTGIVSAPLGALATLVPESIA